MSAVHEPLTRPRTRNTLPSALVLIAFFLCFTVAQLGYDLVLVARREERLLALKTQFETRHSIRTAVLPIDLSTPNAAAEVHKKCREAFPSKSCALLVNNAGFCFFGDFAEQSEDAISRLIHVNILATVELTRAFLPEMLENDRGRILVISSIVAHFWVPHISVYCASKAFLTHWAMSLIGELVDTGVSVTCVEPGGTKTEFFEAQGASDVLYTRLPLSMEAKKVALAALAAMWKAKARQIIGIVNWWNVGVVEALTSTCQMLINRLVFIKFPSPLTRMNPHAPGDV
eukprot:GEMP01063972.1.p1 GENE.GEMP01063972.1~~GEMP01063972.1.p1  ORF type:complete len:298 (+),score=61.67 GEMP01063972.1:35-895(+)